MHRLPKSAALAALACLLASACTAVPPARPESPPAAAGIPAQDPATARRTEMISALRTSPFLSVAEQEDATLLIQIRSTDAFTNGRATPSDGLRAALEHIAQVMQRYDGFIVCALGHTDSSGSATRNAALSTARAEAAARQLAVAGLDPARVQFEGRGEADPIASNDSPEGRAVNRRVDILIRPAQ